MAAISLQLLRGHTACGSLLRELQHIWDEVGMTNSERENVFLEMEQEFLGVYRSKLEQASMAHSRLLQKLTDAKAELFSLISALGEHADISSLSLSKEVSTKTLRGQIAELKVEVDRLQQKKEERVREFVEVEAEINAIHIQISGSPQNALSHNSSNEKDLSLRRLEQYHSQLEALQAQKNVRLQKILDYVHGVHELCSVLGMDFCKTLTSVHPSLIESTENPSKSSVSDETLEKLANALVCLKKEKTQRIRKLQDLGASLVALWNLMSLQIEEQYLFPQIMRIIGVLTEEEITSPSALALTIVDQAESEVARLNQLKASRMKDIVMKKQMKLEEICRLAHLHPVINPDQDKMMVNIESGIFDSAEVLATMDHMIDEMEEETHSRQEILEKVERWISACEEENWLEDYDRDGSRYNARRGAHINFRHAERARYTMKKLPALVDSLVAKVKAWEEHRGMPFLYDGVRLVGVLEEYKVLRYDKEDKKRQMKDKKRLQEKFLVEAETFFGSRLVGTKPSRGLTMQSNGGNGNASARRLASGGVADLVGKNRSSITPSWHHCDVIKDSRKLWHASPQHSLALSKGETSYSGSSFSSSITNGSEPASPMGT